MPGSTPYEAFAAFVEPLQDALGCVARAKLWTTPDGKRAIDKTHGLLTGKDREPLALRGEPKLFLRVAMRYSIITDDERGDPFRVTTRAYDYEVTDSDRAHVLSYHWHPSGRSHVTTPHAHLGSTQLQPEAVLKSNSHVDTGRISLEAVIRTAIGLGALPLCDDWQQRLADSEDLHKLWRSWN